LQGRQGARANLAIHLLGRKDAAIHFQKARHGDAEKPFVLLQVRAEEGPVARFE
jgi:hypothetical protein